MTVEELHQTHETKILVLIIGDMISSTYCTDYGSFYKSMPVADNVRVVVLKEKRISGDCADLSWQSKKSVHTIIASS